MESKKENIEGIIQQHKVNGLYEAVFKRLFDILLSGIAIVCLSGVILVVAILVRINLGSPVVFTQKRTGKNGKIFKLYKFRSMSNEKDKDGNLLPNDKRLNKFGKTLRSTSLDELPELVNIFKGNMSIVGPRPLMVNYLKYYNARDTRRHEVSPGLTGLAQVSGRNALTWEDKFQKDVEYVDNITFLEDIKIILLTVKTIFKRKGIECTEGHQSVMDYFKANSNRYN